jgi:peptidoglycan/xylan/chitin deacetylase (PgdA/CDA1 family)
LLDILKAKGVKATFYVLGVCVTANPAVLQRAVAEGHEIGNHSWDHKALTKGGGAGVASQINQTNDVIENVTGKKPTTVRPPYGATNATITRRLNEEFGLKVIMWDVDPLDWKVRNSAHVKDEILKATKSGSIVLAHDIHPTTVEAMAGTIDALKEKGFQFVTVSELLAMDRPLPPATPPPAPAPETTVSKKEKRS